MLALGPWPAAHGRELARADHRFLPHDYLPPGVPIGDGVTRALRSAMGVSTLAGLQDYRLEDGSRPYARIGVSPYGNYAALPMLTALPAGATTIAFTADVTVGGPSFTGTLPPGSQYIPVTAVGMANLRPQMMCAGGGMPPGSLLYVINPAASLLWFPFQRSMGPMPAGTHFSCGFDVSKIRVGSAMTGFGQAPGATVTAVETRPGAQSVTFAPGLMRAEPAFTAVEFWSSYSDAQIAAATPDWLAIQTALIQAKLAPGGRVAIPAGTYNQNLGLIQPGSVDRGHANGVDLVGSGRTNTRLVWVADTGVGSAALTCEFRVTNASQCRGLWSDFAVTGPIPTTMPGSTPVQMDGLGEGGHRDITRMNVENFHAGLAITSDQTKFSSLNFYQNFYSIYFDLQDTYGNFGNHEFDEVLMENSGMAGIAVSPNFQSRGIAGTAWGALARPIAIFARHSMGRG